MMKPEPQNISLERNILVSKSLPHVITLLIFFLTATGLLYAQGLDEGSLVPAEDTQVDAATSGDITAGGATPAPVPAAGVEDKIELEMEAAAVEKPAAEPEEPAEAPATTETKAVEEGAGEAMKEAAADLRNQPAKRAAKVAQPVGDKSSVNGKLGSVVREEALRRQAEEQHGRECLAEAEKAFEKRDYENAAKLLTEAKKFLNIRAGTEVEFQRAKAELGETYYKWALLLRRQGDLEEAVKKANSAVAERYPGAGRLVTSIANEIKGRPPKVPSPPSARWKEPELKAKEESVSELLTRGRQYFMTGELDDAQTTYERVLKRDPYNTEAIRLMEKVGQAKYDKSTMELNATRRDMMADVRKTWNPRTYALMVPTETADKLQPKVTAPDKSDRLKILDKMDKIKIPEIDFRQANINDVVAFLQAASVEYDESETEVERKGVNIILNLGAAPAAAPPAEQGVAFPEAAGGPAPTPGEVPLISFSARYLSLLEALKAVCDISNLKSRIEGNIVMIVPINAPEGSIVHRMYDVLSTVNDRIISLASEVGKGGGGGEIGGVQRLGQETITDRPEWKQFFADMGVKWPEGSKIKYLPTIGKIVVANTADNLTVFEKILATLNVVPNQIEIEARFVEVKQTDTSSLGFEWLLTDAWEVAQKKGSGRLALGARERIEVPANSTVGGFTKGNRFLDQMTAGGTGSGSVADDVVTLASVLTNPEISLVIHALEQKGNADLLSAPKVTTQSGQEATIKVVTEYIYPTEFTVTPITGAGLNGIATIVGGVVEPGGFETREVGIILKVTPEVSTEGQMINLTMSPEVVTDPIWKDYGSTYTAPDGSQQVLNMQQPFFHTRSVVTSISIYNGATVVMGGMINEFRTETDDKIPFLGDIPLVGRLFRSKTDASEKRNLLIFVTARLVDPAGKPVMTTESTMKTLSPGL